MVLTHIFSVVSIILGLYLLISYFTQESSSSSAISTNDHYHLGCFLNQHQTSHSSLLTDRVSALQEQIKNNISLNMHHSKALRVPDDFNAKSVKLASEIEIFIDHHLQTKQLLKNYVQLSTGVRSAFQEYKECWRDFSQQSTLDEKDCLSNWEKYKSCSGDLQALKEKLKLQFGAKEAVTLQIQQLLRNDYDPAPNPAPNQDEEDYKRKLRLLEEKEKRIEIEIKNLEEKISTKEYYISTLWNDFKHAEELYRQCHENRKEFKLCEEISKEVRTIGYGQIEKLNLWLKNKFKTLNRLQKMIEAGGSTTNVQQLKTLLKKGTAEYQEMLKLFIETKVKMSKHCGCSEEEQKKLKQNTQVKKVQAEEKEQEVIKLKALLSQHETDLKNTVNEKDLLLKQWEERIISITIKTHTEKVDKINALKLLNEKQQEIDQRILDYEAEFDKHERICLGYQGVLRNKLPTIEKIKDCAGKLHYYTHLLHKLKKQEPKGLVNDQMIRQRLRNQLQEYKL